MCDRRQRSRPSSPRQALLRARGLQVCPFLVVLTVAPSTTVSCPANSAAVLPPSARPVQCAPRSVPVRHCLPWCHSKLAGPVSTPAPQTPSGWIHRNGRRPVQDTPLIPRTFTGDALSWVVPSPSWPYQFAPNTKAFYPIADHRCSIRCPNVEPTVSGTLHRNQTVRGRTVAELASPVRPQHTGGRCDRCRKHDRFLGRSYPILASDLNRDVLFCVPPFPSSPSRCTQHTGSIDLNAQVSASPPGMKMESSSPLTGAILTDAIRWPDSHRCTACRLLSLGLYRFRA